MNTFRELWQKFAGTKDYREEFVTAQIKRGIPFQIRTLMKQFGFSQEELARRAGLTQGVVSRAANPNYGNLTLNTLIRIAAGFDVAFIAKFVPFSELGKWFIDLSEESVHVKNFEEENAAIWKVGPPAGPVTNLAEFMRGLPTGSPFQDFVQGPEEGSFASESFAFALTGQACGHQVPISVPSASGANTEETAKLSGGVGSGPQLYLVPGPAALAKKLPVCRRLGSRKKRSRGVPVERDYGRTSYYTPAVAV